MRERVDAGVERARAAQKLCHTARIAAAARAQQFVINATRDCGVQHCQQFRGLCRRVRVHNVHCAAALDESKKF